MLGRSSPKVNVMPEHTSISVIQRLLQEISWDGQRIKLYRNGGRGYENVLTAEVLQGLDFLPREHFLGAVIRELNGASDETKAKLIRQIETASLALLPAQIPFKAGSIRHQTETINPDGLMVTHNVYAFIEAKRIKASSFQLEQLAREFVAVHREAKTRSPLLILFLGQAPPVKIGRTGRKALKEAITDKLDSVLRKVDSSYTASELESRIDQTVAWITWDAIAKVVNNQMQTFPTESASVRGAIERTANAVINAIHAHH